MRNLEKNKIGCYMFCFLICIVQYYFPEHTLVNSVSDLMNAIDVLNLLLLFLGEDYRNNKHFSESEKIN